MGNWAEKTMYENPQRDSRGYSNTQVWEVYPYLDLTPGTLDPNGYVDPTTVLTTQYPVNLPTFGSSLPPYGLCVGVRIIEVKSRTCILVGVFYRSYGLFVGGPRPSTSSYSDTRYITLPIWNRRTDGTVVFWVENDTVQYPRTTIVRVETRFIGGSAVNQVMNAVAINAGTVWIIDGLQYILSDRTRVVYDGGAYTRAEYAFERACEVPAIAPDPGGTLYGNDIAIPFLPALYLYSSRPNPTTSANPPQIAAVPPPADFGGPLHAPPYPSLPGFP